jgi:putative transposase
MISKGHSKLSVVKQCELIGIHRSGLYYNPKQESALNLKLMRLIDQHYLEHPYKGAPQMYTWLRKDKGFTTINHKRVERLYYKVMGLRALQPGKHTSKRNKEHKVFPYLLVDEKIERTNQVWQIDITYIPMKKGFMYMTAIIDVHSRYLVNWSVSNNMDTEWVCQCMQEAFDKHGRPEIVNTDQGSQFTSDKFSSLILTDKQTRLSMDGKGRATDNAFIERFWRSLKYEKIYLNPPSDGLDLFCKIKEYIDYYNNNRRHSSIDDQRPTDLYFKQLKAVA